MISSDRSRLVELTRLTLRAAEAYERPDLANSLRRLDAALTGGGTRVVVAGDFKRGKSAVVNGLLNARICSTDETRTTERPTIIGFGEQSSLAAVRLDDEGNEQRSEIDATSLKSAQDGLDDTIERLEVRLNRRLLAGGLEVVDCPAAAGEGDPGRVATLAAATEADAVLFVTDAGQELNAHEFALVEALAERCPTVIVVTTKIDLTAHWRRVVERDTATLERHGLLVPSIPVSSAVREAALQLEDRELNDESGYPLLLAALKDRVIGEADEMVRLRAGRLIRRAVADMETALRSEYSQLTSDANANTADDVEAARDKADGLRASNSRWQRRLTEGAGDLQTEVEHQLLEALRSVTDEALDRVEEINPAKDWETFEPWLRDQLAETVEAAMVAAHEGMNELTADAAAAFADVEIEIQEALSGPAAPDLNELDVRERMQRSRAAVLGDGLAAIRGSYSGLLMFGMLGSLFGFALLNPVTIALGVGLGGKAVKDERARMLGARRQKASTAVRQYIDQASSRARKELRSAIRNDQRAVREHLAEQADQLVKAAEAALLRARQNAQSDTAARTRRRAQLEAELRRIKELRGRVDQTLGSGSPS